LRVSFVQLRIAQVLGFGFIRGVSHDGVERQERKS